MHSKETDMNDETRIPCGMAGLWGLVWVVSAIWRQPFASGTVSGPVGVFRTRLLFQTCRRSITAGLWVLQGTVLAGEVHLGHGGLWQKSPRACVQTLPQSDSGSPHVHTCVFLEEVWENILLELFLWQ